MLSTIFGKAAGLVDKQFFVGLLLPCLAFTAAMSSLVITAFGWSPATKLWGTLSSTEHWLVAAGLAIVVFFVASVLGAQINLVLAWWEGYWRPEWLSVPGKRLQQRRFRRLDDANPWESTRKFREFPTDPDVFLPTGLGNALLAAENYSRERYGLDSVFFWPRLYLLMPADVRKEVDAARLALDQSVVIATLSFLTSFLALVMGLAGCLSVAVWAPTVGGTALLGLMTYRSAVAAAVTFGDLVRSVPDLFRRDLLTKMGLTPPETPDAEKALWTAFSMFLRLGFTDTDDDALIRYPTAQELPAPAAPQPCWAHIRDWFSRRCTEAGGKAD
jgi:hypothetical protein